jgi:hypothetical protein
MKSGKNATSSKASFARGGGKGMIGKQTAGPQAAGVTHTSGSGGGKFKAKGGGGGMIGRQKTKPAPKA